MKLQFETLNKFISFLIMIIFFVAVFLFGPNSEIEDFFTDIKFRLRGNEKADSSIVIIYLNNQDINNLGGYPIPRIYFASLIHALHELNVGAIGIDLVFEKPNTLYPDYDTLLVEAVKSAGNVVLAQYAASENVYAKNAEIYFKVDQPIGSFHDLYDAAASNGYTNISTHRTIRSLPLFYWMSKNDEDEASTQPYEVESFVKKIIDVVSKKSNQVQAAKKNSDPWYGHISVNPSLRHINYAGDKNSYRMYPFVSFLKSYDSLSRGNDVAIPSHSFSDAIVLVAVVAEGRSQFVQTSLDNFFPSVLLHAAALETIIKKKYIVDVNHFFLYVCLLPVLVFMMVYKKRLTNKMLILSFVILFFVLLSLNQFFFSTYRLNIPVAPIIVVLFVSYGYRIFYQHHLENILQTKLGQKLESLADELDAKTNEIQSLRRDLAFSTDQSKNFQKLQNQVEGYENDIVKLKKQLDDLTPSSQLRGEEIINPEFEGIVYSSSGPMKDIVQQLRSVATEEVTVMLYGESGTGKELAARLIHRLSNRREKEFIAVNCGALTETLLESELFGYEKGAFTGADRTHIGRFERANGGTLFLDEIAETSEAFQVKLLRVLQEGEFERVGANQTISVDVRIIAATNKDLKQYVAEKKFREDLYYRLHVIPITLPPLRERKIDIPLLINFYRKKNNSDIAIADSVINALQMYHWPGNVRELESVLMRAMILAKTGSRKIIRLSDLPPEIVQEVRRQSDLSQLILEMLQRKEFAHGSINLVAQELGGLDRSTVTEYFRGIIFQTYIDSNFEIESTVRKLSKSADQEIKKRVEKKISDYLNNLEKEIDRTQSIEALLPIIHSRYKNLPQKFHTGLETIVRHFYLSHD